MDFTTIGCSETVLVTPRDRAPHQESFSGSRARLCSRPHHSGTANENAGCPAACSLSPGTGSAASWKRRASSLTNRDRTRRARAPQSVRDPVQVSWCVQSDGVNRANFFITDAGSRGSWVPQDIRL